VTTDRHFTSRPFIVAACATCGTDITQTVMPRLREVVRNCPHAVLVVTDRLLGRLADSSMGSGRGVLLALQPCTADRTPLSAVCWVGPVSTEAQARSVCDWIARGDWNRASLPPALRLEVNPVTSHSVN